MAQTSQGLNIAQNLLQAATNLSNAWVQIQKYNELYIKAGISYSSGDFAGTTLVYFNPASMATLITQLNAFNTWMVTGGNGDIIFAASPGTPVSI